MNFQDVILNLNNFWAQRGCVLIQSYDTEVGAGTFHPTTLLKALGPEPWKVAYGFHWSPPGPDSPMIYTECLYVGRLLDQCLAVIAIASALSLCLPKKNQRSAPSPT